MSKPPVREVRLFAQPLLTNKTTHSINPKTPPGETQRWPYPQGREYQQPLENREISNVVDKSKGEL